MWLKSSNATANTGARIWVCEIQEKLGLLDRYIWGGEKKKKNCSMLRHLSSRLYVVLYKSNTIQLNSSNLRKKMAFYFLVTKCFSRTPGKLHDFWLMLLWTVSKWYNWALARFATKLRSLHTQIFTHLYVRKCSEQKHAELQNMLWIDSVNTILPFSTVTVKTLGIRKHALEYWM